jgi:hypothetical protein
MKANATITADLFDSAGRILTPVSGFLRARCAAGAGKYAHLAADLNFVAARPHSLTGYLP